MKYLKIYWMVLIVALVACDDDVKEYTLDAENIAGNITDEVYMSSDIVYHLDGNLIVAMGARLTIEAGTQIVVKGGTSSYIAVEQGGRLYAEGTAEKPIVITSDVKTAGSWGGLVICGSAPTNLMGNTNNSVQAEVTDLLYGGDERDDNSGVLTYVRVEYSGYNYDDDKQFNGFSFFGVGSETVVHHISSYESKDDGIEFFGGNVNAEYLVSINSHDDGIDFTDGWQGTGSFWYVYNSTKSGIEGSNNATSSTATPVTAAQLSNLTVYKMGERPWYLKKGSGQQTVDNIVIGGLEENKGDAYFYYEENDLTTIDNVNNGKVVISGVRFVERGAGNTTDASGALKIGTNDVITGAGAWTDEATLAPEWLGNWAKGSVK